MEVQLILGITKDPVMEFVASEDEVELDSINVSDVKVHTFFVKEHIDVHMPPKNLRTKTEGMNFSEIRPILRFPSNSPRSCTGSQTDISALNSNLELNYKGKYLIQSIFLLKILLKVSRYLYYLSTRRPALRFGPWPSLKFGRI